MKVVGYLRVSTDRQAEDGFGMAVQEAKVRAWCKEGGHRLVGIFRDEGISGTKGLGEREGLADAIAAIRGKSAEGIVVPKLDRLARDLIVQEQALAEVWRLGGQVFTCAPGEADYLTDDPDDPSRKLIRQVLGAVSEYERAMIVVRLRSGRRAKAARGGYAYGAPPFGYRVEGRELVDDEDEQEALDLMAELHNRGCSLREIAEELNSEGVKTKRGGTWHPQSVSRCLLRLPVQV